MTQACHSGTEPDFHFVGNILNRDTADYPELSRAFSPLLQVEGKFQISLSML